LEERWGNRENRLVHLVFAPNFVKLKMVLFGKLVDFIDKLASFAVKPISFLPPKRGRQKILFKKKCN
jgi:hypothetical protein